MAASDSDNEQTAPLIPDNKLLDVVKGKTAASPNSKPVITRHKLLKEDPMVAAQPSKNEADSTKIAVKVITKDDKEAAVEDVATSSHKVIKPLSDAEKTPEDEKVETANDTQPSPDDSVKPHKKAETAKQPDKAAEEESDSPIIEEILPGEHKEESKQPTKETEINTLSSSPDASVKPDDTEKIQEPTAVPTDKQATDSEIKTEEGTVDKAPDESTKEPSAESIQKQKAAEQDKINQEELAREAGVKKLIEEKTYFVQVGQAKRGRTARTTAVIIILILLLGIVAADLAVDAGYVKTTLFKPPIDLIKNN